MEEKEMKIETLTVQSLPQALRKMAVGETCYAPEDFSNQSVRVKCSEMKSEGMVFSTSTHNGRTLITRIG